MSDFEAPPNFIAFEANFRELVAHGGRYAAKCMFNTSPNFCLNAIALFGCVTKRVIACALFVDQAFISTKVKLILKALT